MEIIFKEEYLQAMYLTGQTDKMGKPSPAYVTLQICRTTINKLIMIEIPGVDPQMIANNLEPAFPTHPGEIVKDEIEYRGISQRKLAEQMGIGYSVLNEILNARRPVTEKTAMMFEAALGLNAETLIRLQTKYNMRMALKDKTFMQRLNEIRKMAAIF